MVDEEKVAAFQLSGVSCPVCGNGINWVKSIQHYSYDWSVVLLAECWPGYVNSKKPRHLFVIKIEGLPVVKTRAEEEDV